MKEKKIFRNISYTSMEARAGRRQICQKVVFFLLSKYLKVVSLRSKSVGSAIPIVAQR